MAAILDHLDAERCLVGGNSGGAPHALATGALLRDRVGLQGGVIQVDGWIDDDLAFTRDWGFDPRELTVPTYIWHGSADLMAPFHHAEWLATKIPGAVPHLLDGEGHISVLVGRFGAMLDELVPHL